MRMTFSLVKLTEVVRDRKPLGFIVSEAIWTGISARIPMDVRDQILIDRKMPATEFEAVFTHKVWLKRSRDLVGCAQEPGKD